MSIENFLIDNNVIENAKRICSVITGSERSRAIANVVASDCVSEYFINSSYEVDTSSGLHNVSKVLEEYEISDVYLNGAYIDVRMCQTENDLCVPVSHFDKGILPDAYMFIKIDDNLASYKVLGFILPESVKKDTQQQGYYSISTSQLFTIEELSEYIDIPKNEYEIDDVEIFKYLEGTLENADDFIKKLIYTKSARQKLIQYCNAQNIFNFVSQSGREKPVSNQFTQVLDEGLEIATENSVDQGPDETLSYPEYTTTAVPSLDLSYEETKPEEEISETVIVEDSMVENSSVEQEDSSEIVDGLFVPNQQGEEDEEPFVDGDFDINAVRAKQNRRPILIAAALIAGFALMGVGGFMLYKNLNASKNEASLPPAPVSNTEQMPDETTENGADVASETKDEVMPNETVEKTTAKDNTNEGNAVSVPEIERNLDASVLVSNLKIDWEVPYSYASNTSATRYFMKLGKIIQLNLKAELLLLNKPPLSNRIAVEIKYDNSAKAFDVVGITASSGEKTIDDLILQTVSKALKMKLSSNMDSFEKASGNPILIIKL